MKNPLLWNAECHVRLLLLSPRRFHTIVIGLSQSLSRYKSKNNENKKVHCGRTREWGNVDGINANSFVIALALSFMIHFRIKL